MAYYFDENGNLRKKKEDKTKKKSQERYTFKNGELVKKVQEDDISYNDIAPVKGGNKDSVFKSGGFSDGVDGIGDFFGDLGQTILGTTLDLSLGIAKGAGRLVEGVVDLGTYGVAGVADLFGADEFAKKTKKVAQYSATDEWTKGATDYFDQYSVLGNKADMVSEGIGQVGAIILTGGAAAGLGTVGATALTTGLTGLSGMGSGMNEAYAMGASDGNAFAYGLAQGSVEAVSELIFGGLGKGFKAVGVSKGLTSIDDVFAKKISNTAAKFITSEAGQKIVGNTLEWAVKSGAEGVEEVISGFGSAVAKDLFLLNDEDEKAFWGIVEDENLLEQFVVGSITSAIAQSGYVPGMTRGSLRQANKTGRDFVSGLSKNEQTVIDKVYEQRLAEESKNRTLSKQDKNKLYDRVVDEVKRGYVSTDEIESILGGKTYEGYKSLTEKEKSLKARKTAIEKEIKELVKTPKYELTVEQDEKITALREEAKGIKEELQNLGIRTAKNNLFNEVNKLTSKDTYLRESYNDLIRQTQDLQIDENQYKGTKFEDAAKKTIENARNAGASNSIKVRDFVEFSAKYSSVSGTVVDFKDENQIKQILEQQLNSQITKLSKSTTEADKAKLAKLQEKLKQVQEGEIKVNGVKTKDGVAINIKSPNYLNVVLGHEVTHFFENKKAYEALQKAAFKYAKTKGDYEGRREVLEVLYDGIDGTSVDYELTADLVGDYLFTDYDFMKSLSTDHRNVFQYAYDQIKYMFKLATAGSKEARELEKVMHQFERALRESVETSQNAEHNEATTQFSLRTKPAPKKTQEVYKLMRLKDGEIYPLFIDSTEPLKIGEWYDADSPNLDFLKEMPSGVFLVDANNGTYQTFDEYLQESGERKTKYPSKKAIEKATAEGKRWVYIEDTAKAQKRFGGETRKYWNIGINGSGGVSTFSMRPGYHAGSLPTMRQIGKGANKDLRDDSFVWTVGEVPADIDYQAEAEQNPDKDIPTHIPEDGYYLKATNADKAKSQADRVGWYVAGAYKINRIISDSEARQVIDNWNNEHPDTPVEYDYDRESGMDFDADQMKLVPKSDTQFMLSNSMTDIDKDDNIGYNGFDFYTDSEDFFLDVAKDDRDIFPLSLSKKTTGMAKDEIRTVEIYSDKRVYFFEATGYMQGRMLKSVSTDNRDGYTRARKEYINEINGSSETFDSWINAFSAYRKGAGSDISDIGIGQGKNDADGIYGRASELYSTGTQERSWQNFEDDPEEVKSVIKALREEYGYTENHQTNDIAPVKEVSSDDDAFFDGENSETRFSLSKSVEQTKNLFAVHNLKSDELIKTLEIGGLPMPSIAVITAEQGHEKYGDVSLIFPKDTIDPQANKDNKVYGGDAWTPTYPRIEYKANEGVQKKVRDKYYELANKIGYDAVRPLYRYAHELESALNSEQGEANLLDWLYKDTKLMQIYLEDSGKGKVEDVVKETRTEASESDKEMSQWFIDKLGEDLIRAFKTPTGENPLSHRKNYIEEHKAEIASAWESFCREVYQITEEQIQNVMRDTTGAMYMKFMRNAEQYLNNGGVTIKTETDYDATEKAIEEKAADGYKEWVDGLFKGAQEKTGIRNDKDIFTSRGDRRSWDALHWENTLENVVKAMKAQDQTGADAFSPASAIFAVAHKRYNSIDEVKADSNRLGRVSEDEYKAMEEGYASRLAQIANSIKDTNERNPFIASDEAAQQIIDAVRNYKTKSGMLRYMQKWNSRVTESTVDDILSLVSDIANMPTGYFEAKPQRAVGLEEVGVFVIPNNVDVKLKQELLNKGYNIAEYDPNVEGDRKRVVNQFEEYKFSLSDVGENRTLGGSYRFDGKDFRVKTEQDIAPIIGTTPTTDKTVGDVAPAEQTLDEKISAKLQNLQTELENNKKLRDESNADFDSEIARLQAEYDAKKDKNTKVANNLLRRIERIQRLKANVNADYDSRINSLADRVQKMQTPQYRRSEQRKAKQEQRSNEIRNLIGDTSTWKDKKLGIFYQINTLHRNLRDVVRDANGNQDIAKADEIYEYLQGSYNHNEAQLKRESREIKQKYADMKINKYESEYIQMLGEFKYNPDTKLTFETVDGYFNKHKDSIDIDKVNKAIEESRKDYDNLIKRVNEVLREQGMKEIGYREGYFPHFTDTKQGWLAKLLNWKTIDTEIPTDIAGLTEEFEPVRTYQSYDKHRKSDETDYNFLKGFDTYVHGALDWIYHIEDIQKRRAFEHEIRYSHSEQGIRDRIDEIRQNETLDDDEARAAMDEVYRKAKNPLNNFVTDLRNSTNNLAGKKSTADREMEYATNRKIYSTMTNISNRVSADMVVGSISSALTNWIPITQSWGQVSPVSSLRAVGDVIRNAYRDDGMIKKSDFMTNRLLNEENLNQTGWDKVSNVAGGLMNIFDHISTEVVWRSKYQENLNNGMSEAEAIHNADIFAENVMAGRSRGNMPTIYNSKNPITKMLTAFQLEVGNQYGYMFKDMPQDIGKENIGKLTAGYAKMFIGAYLYNALFSKLTGRDAAFDPIGIIEDLLKDLGFGGDDEEEEVDVKGALSGLGENIAQEIPYIGGLLGGGRVPISSAIPYDNPIKTITGTMEDVADKDWANLTKEWLNLFYYGVLPMGGGQLKKFNEGMAMFSDDHPVSGSYTTSGNLRFPVEDTFGNRVQAALFGQYASKNAREYFDNDYAPLKEKQIQEYIDVDMPIKDYWEYREGLKGKDTLGEKAAYISELDLPIAKKNLLINNIADRDEPIDLTDMVLYDDWGEFDYAKKYPDKYEFLKANNISVEEYKNFDEETKEAYSWAYQNPDKFALAKAVAGDVVQYKRYTKSLSKIKADKDAYGDSITGSRKEKVLNYINNLDADYETKIILWKSEYPSDDTYNMEIINYLNNRQDLTYDERVAIFTELGFTVSNGTVYWD